MKYPINVVISRTDLEKKVLPDDDYPLLYAAQRIQLEAGNLYIDKELFHLLDHPEAEDFALESWIDKLLTKRSLRRIRLAERHPVSCAEGAE